MNDIPVHPGGLKRRRLSIVIGGACALLVATAAAVVPDAANAATQYCSNRFATSGGKYEQLWTNGQGQACITINSATSYTTSWSSIGNFVAGVGWNPGSSYRTVNYSSSMNVYSGTGLLSLYGWTSNPRVEYYVIENYKSPNRNGTYYGQVSTNGGTYDIILNHTSSGTPQYLAIRTSPRTSGTITFSNIVNAWASHGMNLGSMGYQIMATEAWGGGSGNSSVTIW
jgi:endo-1,4-beta-xylanase